MSSEQKVLLLKVKTDCGKEGQTYLAFDFITKDPSLLLPNVQQIAYDLLPGIDEVQASYMDGDGDRCTLTDQTASDALHFAVGGSDEKVLEIQVQDRSNVEKAMAARGLPASCSSCAQLKSRLAEAKIKERAADSAALQGAQEELKRKSDEIARLTALCDTLQAEVITAGQKGSPQYAKSDQLSASVSECAPLILGTEAHEDVSRRGCVGQDFKDMVEKLGGSQAKSLGCIIIAASLDEKKSHDPVPACAKFTLVNDGSVPWPETTAVVSMKGESFGVPIVHLGTKGPGESEEVALDLSVPPSAGNSKACSVWSIVNAATGTALGPLVVLEIEWRSQ